MRTTYRLANVQLLVFAHQSNCISVIIVARVHCTSKNSFDNIAVTPSPSVTIELRSNERAFPARKSASVRRYIRSPLDPAARAFRLHLSSAVDRSSFQNRTRRRSDKTASRWRSDQVRSAGFEPAFRPFRPVCSAPHAERRRRKEIGGQNAGSADAGPTGPSPARRTAIPSVLLPVSRVWLQVSNMECVRA